jgi:hypothetical protein
VVSEIGGGKYFEVGDGNFSEIEVVKYSENGGGMYSLTLICS